MADLFDHDPELAAEQAHLDGVHACPAGHARQGRTGVGAGHLADAEMSTAFDLQAIRMSMENRIFGLSDSKSRSRFGRIDTDDGDRHHIGRRHVEDERGDPVVVDWRAPVSTPFYRATWADPLGLHRRRRFAIDGRDLAGLFDEDFDRSRRCRAGASAVFPIRCLQSSNAAAPARCATSSRRSRPSRT